MKTEPEESLIIIPGDDQQTMATKRTLARMVHIESSQNLADLEVALREAARSHDWDKALQLRNQILFLEAEKNSPAGSP